MNYRRIYDSIIEKAKTRDKVMQYFETHHIHPKCMGGTNEVDNLVNLTLEEHFVCHQLLVKIYPGEICLQYALRMMCIGMPLRKNNKLYSWIKRLNYKPRRTKSCKFCSSLFYARDSTKKELCSMQCRDNYIKSKRISLICKFCNIHFTVAPSHSNQSFCSENCRLSVKLKGRSIKNCECCNCEFTVTPSQAEKKFCSLECSSKNRRKREKLKCNECGNVVERILSAQKRQHKKCFCSEKCYNRHRQITKLCIHCNRLFTAQKHLNRRFCSRQCYLDDISSK